MPPEVKVKNKGKVKVETKSVKQPEHTTKKVQLSESEWRKSTIGFIVDQLSLRNVRLTKNQIKNLRKAGLVQMIIDIEKL